MMIQLIFPALFLCSHLASTAISAPAEKAGNEHSLDIQDEYFLDPSAKAGLVGLIL